MRGPELDWGRALGVLVLVIAMASLGGCGEKAENGNGDPGTGGTGPETPTPSDDGGGREQDAWPNTMCPAQGDEEAESAKTILEQIKQMAEAAFQAGTIDQALRDKIVRLADDCLKDDGTLDADVQGCGTKGDSCCACIRAARAAAQQNSKSGFELCASRLDHDHGGD